MPKENDSPLRIQSVTLSGGAEIGMTLCPGKKQSDALSGNWNRDLYTDIAAIAKWGAVAVVSVMEDHEFHALKVQNMGDTVERAGMDWHHLPITDGGVPDEKFEDSWIYSSHRLRQELLGVRDAAPPRLLSSHP
jgi:ADP-ribosyl-[dinitrogen reductase] hydrolase